MCKQERDRLVEELQTELHTKDDHIHELQNQMIAKDGEVEDLRRQLGVSEVSTCGETNLTTMSDDYIVCR